MQRKNQVFLNFLMDSGCSIGQEQAESFLKHRGVSYQSIENPRAKIAQIIISGEEKDKENHFLNEYAFFLKQRNALLTIEFEGEDVLSFVYAFTHTYPTETDKVSKISLYPLHFLSEDLISALPSTFVHETVHFLMDREIFRKDDFSEENFIYKYQLLADSQKLGIDSSLQAFDENSCLSYKYAP